MADRVEVEAAEMDEMWSFIHDKGHQCWLWWAIDHNTKIVLAYCFGTREHKYLDELLVLLSPFKIKCVYCDDNFAYQSRVRVVLCCRVSVILSVLNVNICLYALGVVVWFERVLGFQN